MLLHGYHKIPSEQTKTAKSVTLRACSGFSAGGKNRLIFCQFLRFWRRIAGATQLKKGEKWRKLSRFWLGERILNKLLELVQAGVFGGGEKQTSIFTYYGGNQPHKICPAHSNSTLFPYFLRTLPLKIAKTKLLNIKTLIFQTKIPTHWFFDKKFHLFTHSIVVAFYI